MNVKKKLFYKLGVIPILIVLTAGLAGGAVMAQVEPLQATVSVTVDPPLPGYVLNDGSGVEDIEWSIEFETTPDHYTYEIRDPGDSVVYGPISVDISGMTPPDTATGSYSWTVPAGSDTGDYTVYVDYYSITDTVPEREAGGYRDFRVKQPVEVRKFNDENGNGIMDGAESEITGIWNVEIENPSAVVIYDSTMPAEIDVMGDGTYTATETLETGWVATTTGGTVQTFTVPQSSTIEVWFGNMEQPGNLTIYKYEDEEGDGTYDGGEPLLDGWAFSISGPTSDSGSTVGGSVTFNNIPAGTYTVTETIQSGWRCTDPDSSGVMTGVVVTAGGTTEVYFGNQELGDLVIFKYEDSEDAGTLGTYDSGIDSPWGGWGFTVSGVSGTFTTDGTGYVTVPDLVPGSYTVTEVSAPTGVFYWVCTDPGPSKQETANVPSGGSDEVDFGNQEIEREVPTLGQWGIIALSTVFVALLVWFGVRRRRTA